MIVRYLLWYPKIGGKEVQVVAEQWLVNPTTTVTKLSAL